MLSGSSVPGCASWLFAGVGCVVVSVVVVLLVCGGRSSGVFSFAFSSVVGFSSSSSSSLHAGQQP